MRIVWQSALALVFGFIGGLVATHAGPYLKSRAPEVRAETVRARRFELVDSSGQGLAYWGKDKQGHRISIAFVDEEGRPRAEFGTEASQLSGGQPSAYSPFSALIGSDGKARLRQVLDSAQNPTLAMGDSKSENRLLLGHWDSRNSGGSEADPWDRWSLVFRDPSYGWRDYVEFGVTSPLGKQQRTGYAVLRNSRDQQLSILPKP